jgi:hypothetical protein
MIEIPEGAIPVLALWEIAPKQRVRINVNYGELWRPILWAEAAKDGSVYLSVPLKAGAAVKSGSEWTADGSVSVKYAAGERVPEADVRGGRVSFHASGRVHLGDKRFNGRPFRDGCDEERLLCYFLFAHPSSFEPRKSVRLRDVTTDFSIDETSPLQARALLRRGFDSEQPFLDPRATDQRHFIFVIRGTTIPGEMALHLMLFTNREGPWPPFSYILAAEDVPAIDS